MTTANAHGAAHLSDAGAPPRTDLSRYVPRIAVAWDELAPGRQWDAVDGTLCFVDISGFTNLSERLAKRGRIGAEQLTEVLDAVFAAMLQTAYEYGGSLMKFGGDALLLLFSGERHAMRAASAVVAMQGTLRAASGKRTAVGAIKLRMSVGLHSGTIQLFCVGTSHRELMITGPAGTLTTTMEHTAQAGEIVVSPATKELLPAKATSERRGAGWLLRWRKPPQQPAGFTGRGDLSGADVRLWMPTALRSFLTAAAPEPEHRVVTVGFVRFCGVDVVIENDGPAAVASRLQAMIDVIQSAADAEGVTFLATDINEDGGKVILVAGAPAVTEDDEGRMLRTARRIADAETQFDLHIGINRGHVFAGEIGTDYRSTYTVMGDTVNVAARLCAAAWAGRILATPDVLERSHTMYATRRLEPLSVRGKAEALTVYEVGEETGSRSLTTRSDLPFVGRRAEMALVLAALDAVEEPDHAVTTITGEAGIGKSRLIEEAQRARPDLRTFEIRAEPYGTASPYRPFRDPIRTALDIEGAAQPDMAAALSAAVSDGHPELMPFLPLIGDLAHIEVPETSATEAIEPRFRRDRLADVLITVLDGVFDTPTLFIVEDAHWMDEASAHLLERLAGATTDRPWAMITTRRTGHDGFVYPEAETLALQPLDEAASEELVIAATAAAPLRPHEVHAVVQRSGGNPLFIEETLNVVRESGGIDTLPDSLAAVVGTRIDALPPLTRRILRYASVLGRSFRVAALRELLSEDGIELDAATRRELGAFVERDTSGRLRFRHDLARDIAYEGLSFRRRRQLHLIAAAAAERQADGHVEEIADLLATHYWRGADFERAWRFSRIAGDRAKEAYANVEAAANYERALEAARRLDTVTHDERAAVWIDLGDVRGPLGLFDEALDAYRRASRLLAADPVAVADVYYQRALMRERAGAYSQALREVTAGWKLIEHVGSRAADQIRARLAVRRAFIRQAQEQVKEARRLALVAIETAQAAGEQLAEGHARMIVHWANLVLGMPGGAAYGERALRIFEDGDDSESLAAVTNLLGADAYYAGRWDEAVAYYRRGEEAAERSGNVVFAAVFESNIGEVLVDQRRFEEAEPILRRAARVQRGSGWIEGADIAELFLGRLLSERGETEEALDVLHRVRSEHLASGRTGSAVEASIYLAECLVRAGRTAEAEAALQEIDDRAGDFVMQAATMARVRSEILTAQGRPEEALEQARRGLALAEEQGLDYERALTALTADALERLLGLSTSDGQRVEALAILRRLGVRVSAADAA